MELSKLKKEIINYSRELGVDLVGFANLKHLNPILGSSYGTFWVKDLPYAISIAIRLDENILNSLKDAPNYEYFYHYREVNLKLDEISLKLEKFLYENGFKARAIKASKTVDNVRQIGTLTHKVVANYAGLGWIGKSSLLVTPQFGAKVRLATVLTNAVLTKNNNLIYQNCGTCAKCELICPANAIDHGGFTREKCLKYLTKFLKDYRIGELICGLCVKVCF